MNIQRNASKVTVFPEGRIDANRAAFFAAEMEKALKGATDLTLDFSALQYISSSGLRAVMLAAKVMARQGEMRITGVREDVYDVLETTGFTSLIDVERVK